MNLNTDAVRTDLQYELEQHSIELGISRYRESLAKEGNSAVPAGQQLLKAAMRPMIDAVQSWVGEASSGLAARSASLVHFVSGFEEEVVAWVTAHAAISMLHQRPSVAKVALSIAAALEAQVNIEAILSANPALGRKVARQVKRMSSHSSRALFIRRGGVLADVVVAQWDDKVRLRVGTLLLQLFADSTGLVALEHVRVGKKTVLTVRPTESCLKWLEQSHARCELLSPVRLPMVARPRDWTNPFNGGYYTHALRQPLVKTRNRGYLQHLKECDMPWVYAAVNTLQGTEWSVNERVREVLAQLWEASAERAGLPRREPETVAYPWADGVTPPADELHAWKVAAAQAHERNAKSESKRLQVVQKLWVADMMMERGNRFHYVYNLDWRGRMYPVGPALTPQGDDVAKGLLRFSRAVPLGDEGAYWLAIHGANTFGVDKVSFEERVEWVQAHEADILMVAADPLGFDWWMGADSPFCFLAFCLEWDRLQRWVDAGGAQETFESTLPVAFDGSCNGLQNFSAMLRDPVGGAATGLVPTAKPADIYSEVARAAQAIIDKDASLGNEVAHRWVGKMTRKLAKRNTMTVPYGVTKRGMRDQLFAELDSSNSAERSDDASYLAGVNFEAIGHVVVAARRAMDWLRDVAKVASSTGLPVSWTTPSGFLAVQDYREAVGDVVDFQVLGRRFQILLAREGDKLSTRRQALGISPNFVHSLDAAHLMRTVLFCAQDGMVDFAMIHDSYGTHAGHAARLRDNLRQAFVAQYSQPVLENFRAEILAQLPPEVHGEVPPVPPMGALDLEQVLQSDYFFA